MWRTFWGFFKKENGRGDLTLNNKSVDLFSNIKRTREQENGGRLRQHAQQQQRGGGEEEEEEEMIPIRLHGEKESNASAHNIQSRCDSDASVKGVTCRLLSPQMQKSFVFFFSFLCVCVVALFGFRRLMTHKKTRRRRRRVCVCEVWHVTRLIPSKPSRKSTDQRRQTKTQEQRFVAAASAPVRRKTACQKREARPFSQP